MLWRLGDCRFSLVIGILVEFRVLALNSNLRLLVRLVFMWGSCVYETESGSIQL